MIMQLQDFKTISPTEFIELLKQEPSNKPEIYTMTEIDYVEIYSLLKLKFGNPNGIQSFLRSNDSDNLFHWNYTIYNSQVVIDFVYSYRCIQVSYFSKNKDKNSDLEICIIGMLKDSINKNKKEISEIRKNLEFWDLFQNTFLRLNETVASFYNIFMTNYPEEPVEPTYSLDKADVESYLKNTRLYIESINQIKSYGLSLRMLIPVLGESFVNFVLFILGIDEIKNDKRTFETITRNNIDVRVKTLHLYVNGFDNPVDQSNSKVKNFFKLMS